MKKKELIFIDSGFIIALVNEHHDYHLQALELADILEKYHFITTYEVLLKISDGLSNRYRKEATKIINEFIYSEDVEIVESASFFESALEMSKKNLDTECDLVNYLSNLVMQDRNIQKIATFNQYFSQAGFQVLSNKFINKNEELILHLSGKIETLVDNKIDRLGQEIKEMISAVKLDINNLKAQKDKSENKIDNIDTQWKSADNYHDN